MTVQDLGRMAYSAALTVQEQALQEVLVGAPNRLLLVEHDPVLTLGANFHEENLLLSAEQYRAAGISLERTGRGGDVTYHGPGQLVIYPIFQLDLVGRDLHRWLRELEETMIQTAAAFGLTGYRFPPHTGCWVNNRKLAAIGVKVRRWVSMHGIALNCDLDLKAFAGIVPCGIPDYGVTSLSEELGRSVSVEEAKPRVVESFRRVFSEKIDGG